MRPPTSTATTTTAPDAHAEPPAPAGRAAEPFALVDLLDRLLASGVVINGEVTISLADVDLVRISLRALISSVPTLMER